VAFLKRKKKKAAREFFLKDSSNQRKEKGGACSKPPGHSTRVSRFTRCPPSNRSEPDRDDIHRQTGVKETIAGTHRNQDFWKKPDTKNFETGSNGEVFCGANPCCAMR
jgi:hypothetical protein